MALTFGGDDPLDTRGRADCARLRMLPSGDVYLAPERAALETAELIGGAGTVAPALAAIDLGTWRHRAPEVIDTTELQAWFTDPHFDTHGGESVVDFVARLTDWASNLPDSDTTAVVGSGVAQGIVAAATGGDFWSVEIAPAQTVDLTRRGGRWRVRVGA